MARADTALLQLGARVPRLWPREDYIIQVATLRQSAANLGWSRRFLHQQLYRARKQAFRRQRRLRKPTRWVSSWDRQVNGLLRRLSPPQIIGVMYMQAADR